MTRFSQFFVIKRSKAYKDDAARYQWHLKICPRTRIPSGFEPGSGLYVNTISPEIATAQLRAVKLGEEEQ